MGSNCIDDDQLVELIEKQVMELIEKELEYKNGDASDINEKWIMHYSSKHKILLVGEGDFSFSACLAEAFEDASNMVATCLNSRDELLNQYANAQKNLEKLKHKGCKILHQVDVHTMSDHPDLCSKNRLFDRIVFNFPHYHGIVLPWYSREHDAELIMLHQNLVRGFFESAYKLLEKNGQVHVTHKTAYPFNRWKIEELADESDLHLVKKVGFSLWDYPGYSNKKGEGHGDRCDKSFPIGECCTFMFAKTY